MRISDRDEWLFDDTVVTVVEAAPTLGVSRWGAHRLARDRLIAGHHEYGFGRIRFFELASLQSLQAERCAIGKGFHPDSRAESRRQAKRRRHARWAARRAAKAAQASENGSGG